MADNSSKLRTFENGEPVDRDPVPYMGGVLPLVPIVRQGQVVPAGDVLSSAAVLSGVVGPDADWAIPATATHAVIPPLTASRTWALPDVDAYPRSQDLVITDEEKYLGGAYTITLVPLAGSGDAIRDYPNGIVMQDAGTTVRLRRSLISNTWALSSAKTSLQTAPETSPSVVRDLLATVREMRSPRSFGAVGDGVADDTAAIQAFFDWLAAGNVGRDYRGGRYRLTAPIRGYAWNCYKFTGAGIGVTVFICDFNGYDKAVLNLSHPTNPAENTRPKAHTLSDFSIEMSGKVTQPPCNIEERYATDLFAARIYVSHWTPFLGRGTAVRISNAYNCVINEFKVWGAGCSRLSRVVTPTTRFTIAAGTQTLTASEACFTSADVNRGIQLFDGSRLEYFVIYGVTNSTTATVNRNAYQSFSSSTGCFEGVKCNIGAGSNTLYITGQFQTSDVGRAVYIPGAGATTFRGNRPPLRAIITSISSDRRSATLNRTAGNSVDNRYLVISPAFELYGESATGDYGSNDIIIDRLHAEGNAGVPVLAGYGNNIYFDRLKTHGNNLEYIGGTFGAVEHVSLCNLCLFNGEVTIGDGSLIEGAIVNGSGQIWAHAAITVTIGSTIGIGWAGTPFIYLNDTGANATVKWGNREIGTPYSPDLPLQVNDGAGGFIQHVGTFTDSGFNLPRNGNNFLAPLKPNGTLQASAVRVSSYYDFSYGYGLRVSPEQGPTSEGGNNFWSNGTAKLITVSYDGNFDAVNIYTPGGQRSAPIITLRSNGSAGVNTQAPGATWDVNGSLRAQGAATVGETAAQYPTGLIVSESTHASGSKRAGIKLGSEWQLLQDSAGSGAKDFAVYSGTLNRNVLAIAPNGIASFSDGVNAGGPLSVRGISTLDQQGGYTRLKDGSGTSNAINLGGEADKTNYYNNNSHYFQDRGGSANYAIISSSGFVSLGKIRPAAFTVTTVPSGTAGDIIYVSNARKVGEGAGAGTGVIAYYSNNNWRRLSDDSPVAA
ncbi:hypothetical protein FF100_04990 [Methylobacterium terricola]|uniref:Pectate lyase superfamily protein n=1 Tax=Methylobacterium terricola TaxID=2583531 RepID=A0A5C4LKI7_9HYPH|nr:hypothetical protein [Methylobacterium terricola]TNC14934.1 hypothetical protein FF100_04990 [Methylobacterium terricola]